MERLAHVLQVPSAERDQFVRLAADLRVDEIERDLDQLHEERRVRIANRLQPPVSATDLIGRDVERAAVLQHPGTPQHRLITLVGPGGIGKTSLAMQVAEAITKSADPLFVDGTSIVWLASVGRAHDVPLAIAEALECTVQGARPIVHQLVDALHRRSALLVLDNIEHLLGPVNGPILTGLITALLNGAPGVRLLVTSRERLRLRDERVLELSGLSVPTVDHGPGFEQADAVRLFVERAQRVAPTFKITSQTRSAVAHICRRLEGLPLAIELAATWVRALTPGEIAAEVDRALDLLTLTARDATPRHQ